MFIAHQLCCIRLHGTEKLRFFFTGSSVTYCGVRIILYHIIPEAKFKAVPTKDAGPFPDVFTSLNSVWLGQNTFDSISIG